MSEKFEISNGHINYSSGGYLTGFYLHHSCDEWEIGELEQAKQFLNDLQKTINEVEERSKNA